MFRSKPKNPLVALCEGPYEDPSVLENFKDIIPEFSRGHIDQCHCQCGQLWSRQEPDSHTRYQCHCLRMYPRMPIGANAHNPIAWNDFYQKLTTSLQQIITDLEERAQHIEDMITAQTNLLSTYSSQDLIFEPGFAPSIPSSSSSSSSLEGELDEKLSQELKRPVEMFIQSLKEELETVKNANKFFGIWQQTLSAAKNGSCLMRMYHSYSKK